jgi:hypothetical protein
MRSSPRKRWQKLLLQLPRLKPQQLRMAMVRQFQAPVHESARCCQCADAQVQLLLPLLQWMVRLQPMQKLVHLVRLQLLLLLLRQLQDHHQQCQVSPHADRRLAMATILQMRRQVRTALLMSLTSRLSRAALGA